MKVQQENIQPEELKKTKKVAGKKPREKRDIRTVFRKHLATLDIEKLKKPWMATKAFRLVTDKTTLWDWARRVVEDESRHVEHFLTKEKMPVIAVDTENIGLDTRIFTIIKENPDGTLSLGYEVNMEIAGICLSADGVEGLYVPIHHEDGHNISREDVAEVLQWLFDRSHLVFYHAKYDREVIRICLGITLRGYPYFEDVQVLQYINDPKHDFGDEARGQYTGDSGGLKALSEELLGIEQIKSDELMKVRADFFNSLTQKVTQRVQYVPFTWVPTEIALWYAAGDAICTWLLWQLMREKAQSRALIHRIDQEMVESLTFLERQRFLVDVPKHKRTVKWHEDTLAEMEAELRRLALEAGFQEEKQEDGTVQEEDRFNPNSNPQLANLFFKIKKFKIIRMTEAKNPSCDAEVVEELKKLYPDDEFLKLFAKYKDYVALHPEKLRYDLRDNSARIYLKQNVVAGGRLSAAGGDFDVDGGFGLNPQGIKRVEGNWWVRGNILEPDFIPVEEITPYDEADLHPSCFKEVEEEVTVGWKETHYREGSLSDRLEVESETIYPNQFPDGIDESTRNEHTPLRLPVIEKHKVRKKAPGIVNNHIANYMGYAICLVPKCTSCAEKFKILIPNTRMDANQVINIRTLMVAPPGWTFFVIDYSNIEMRAAANCSGEPEFVKEFLEGKGDFHALTASKVFPAFNDPNTDAATKKALRHRAKIMNFALLYGGTVYTIYESMKKVDPNVTWEECEGMVAKYWEGVPVFADWCQKKQAIAKEHMTCQTATGRVINFKSAMESLGLHKPTQEETDTYWDYRNLIKKEEEAKKNGNEELAAKCKAAYDRLWKDQTSGVRNYKDYNSFMGKIQRVAVNIPIQGLAGDFMRISLNRIRAWTLKDPAIQTIFRLYLSVHDEIDFAVKNEYVPFVIPRIMRMMKLRKYHEKMNWRVPIECDCEYGLSWDVEHHLTGDDGHRPAAWTKIAGMENYVPSNFDVDTVKNLFKALTSEDTRRVDRAGNWLKENLHPRAWSAADLIFKSRLLGAHESVSGRKEIKSTLLAALQLDEFWRTDEIPDADEDKMETLEQYEARQELTVKDRGIAPEFGFLGAIPLTANVKRPVLMILGKEEPPEDPQTTVSTAESNEETSSTPETPITTTESEDEVIGEVPLPKKPKKTAPIAPKNAVPELIDMDPATIKRFRAALGIGRNKITVRYQGKVLDINDVGVNSVPNEYLKQS